MTYQTLDQIKEALTKKLGAYTGESTFFAGCKRVFFNEKDSASAAYCRIRDKCLADILTAQSVESVAAALVSMIAALQAQKPAPKPFGYFENAVVDALAVFKEDETDPYFRQLISVGGIKTYFGINLDNKLQEKKHDGSILKPFNSAATTAFFREFSDFDKHIFSNLSKDTRKQFAKDILLANQEETFKDYVANFVLAFMQKESEKWISFSADRIEQFTDSLMKALNQCPGLSANFNQQLLETIQTRIRFDQSTNPQLTAPGFTKNLEVVLSRLDPSRVTDAPPKDTRTLRQRVSEAAANALSTASAKATSFASRFAVSPSPPSSPKSSAPKEAPVDLYALSSLSSETNNLIKDSTGIDFNAYASGYKVRLDIPAHGMAKLQSQIKALEYGKRALSNESDSDEKSMLAAQMKIEKAEFERLSAMDAPHQARLYCNNIIDTNFVTQTQYNVVLLLLQKHLEEAKKEYLNKARDLNQTRGQQGLIKTAFSGVDNTDFLKSAYIFSVRLTACMRIAEKYSLTFALTEEIQSFQTAAQITLSSGTEQDRSFIERAKDGWLVQEKTSQKLIEDNIMKMRQHVNTIMTQVAQQNTLESSSPLAAYTVADLELVAGACTVLTLASKVAQWLPSEDAQKEAAQLKPQILAHQQHIAAALMDKLRFVISGTNAVQRNFDLLQQLAASPISSCLPKCPGYPLIIIETQTEFDQLRAEKGIQEKTTYLVKDSGGLYQSDVTKEIRTFQGGSIFVRDMAEAPSLSAELTQKLNSKLLELGGYSTTDMALPGLVNNVTQLQETPDEFFEHNPDSDGMYDSLLIPKSSFSMAAYFVLQNGSAEQRVEFSGLVKDLPNLTYDSSNKFVLPTAIATQYQELDKSKHANLPEIRDVLRQLSATLLTVETLKAKGCVDSLAGLDLLMGLPANIDAITQTLVGYENVVKGFSGDSKMSALIETIRTDMMSRYQDLVRVLVENSEGINSFAQIDERLEKVNQFIAVHGNSETKQDYLDKSVQAILKNEMVSLDEKINLIQRLSDVLKAKPSVEMCANIINELRKKFSTEESISENYIDYLCQTLNRLKSEEKALLFASLIAEINELPDNQLIVEEKIELIQNLSEQLGLQIAPEAKVFLIDNILKKFEQPGNGENVLIDSLFKLMAGVSDSKERQGYVTRYQAILSTYIKSVLQHPDASVSATIALQLFEKLTLANLVIPGFNVPASQVFDQYVALYAQEKVDKRGAVTALVENKVSNFSANFHAAHQALIPSEDVASNNLSKMTKGQADAYSAHIQHASQLLLTAYVTALKSDAVIAYDDDNPKGLGQRINTLLGATIYKACTRETFIEDQIAQHLLQKDFVGASALIKRLTVSQDDVTRLNDTIEFLKNGSIQTALLTVGRLSKDNQPLMSLLKLAIVPPTTMAAYKEGMAQIRGVTVASGRIMVTDEKATQSSQGNIEAKYRADYLRFQESYQDNEAMIKGRLEGLLGILKGYKGDRQEAVMKLTDAIKLALENPIQLENLNAAIKLITNTAQDIKNSYNSVRYVLSATRSRVYRALSAVLTPSDGPSLEAVQKNLNDSHKKYTSATTAYDQSLGIEGLLKRFSAIDFSNEQPDSIKELEEVLNRIQQVNALDGRLQADQLEQVLGKIRGNVASFNLILLNGKNDPSKALTESRAVFGDVKSLLLCLDFFLLLDDKFRAIRNDSLSQLKSTLQHYDLNTVIQSFFDNPSDVGGYANAILLIDLKDAVTKKVDEKLSFQKQDSNVLLDKALDLLRKAVDSSSDLNKDTREKQIFTAMSALTTIASRRELPEDYKKQFLSIFDEGMKNGLLYGVSVQNKLATQIGTLFDTAKLDLTKVDLYSKEQSRYEAFSSAFSQLKQLETVLLNQSGANLALIIAQAKKESPGLLDPNKSFLHFKDPKVIVDLMKALINANVSENLRSTQDNNKPIQSVSDKLAEISASLATALPHPDLSASSQALKNDLDKVMGAVRGYSPTLETSAAHPKGAASFHDNKKILFVEALNRKIDNLLNALNSPEGSNNKETLLLGLFKDLVDLKNDLRTGLSSNNLYHGKFVNLLEDKDKGLMVRMQALIEHQLSNVNGIHEKLQTIVQGKQAEANDQPLTQPVPTFSQEAIDLKVKAIASSTAGISIDNIQRLSIKNAEFAGAIGVSIASLEKDLKDRRGQWTKSNNDLEKIKIIGSLIGDPAAKDSTVKSAKDSTLEGLKSVIAISPNIKNCIQLQGSFLQDLLAKFEAAHNKNWGESAVGFQTALAPTIDLLRASVKANRELSKPEIVLIDAVAKVGHEIDFALAIIEKELRGKNADLTVFDELSKSIEKVVLKQLMSECDYKEIFQSITRSIDTLCRSNDFALPPAASTNIAGAKQAYVLAYNHYQEVLTEARELGLSPIAGVSVSKDKAEVFIAEDEVERRRSESDITQIDEFKLPVDDGRLRSNTEDLAVTPVNLVPTGPVTASIDVILATNEKKIQMALSVVLERTSHVSDALPIVQQMIATNQASLSKGIAQLDTILAGFAASDSSAREPFVQALSALKAVLLDCGLKEVNGKFEKVELGQSALKTSMAAGKSVGITLNDSDHSQKSGQQTSQLNNEVASNSFRNKVVGAFRVISGPGLQKTMMRIGAALCVGSLFHKFVGAAVLYFSSAMLPLVADVLRVLRNAYA